jgi:hypothetical protein
MMQAADEIERLRKERDEARREACGHGETIGGAMFSNTCAMTLAQKSDRILAQTRGLSGTTPNATQLIEELRSALEENMKEVQRLRKEEGK